MNYELKYLKYKQKYLYLKNNNFLQFGGDTPNINIIKNISLFMPDSDLDLHFNPIYGFLYAQLGYIENIFNFAPDNDEFKIIKRCFQKINNLVLPTNNLRKIDIDEFAKLSSYLYLNHRFKANIDNIKKNIHILTDLLKKLPKSVNKNDLILINNDIFKKICTLKIPGIQFELSSNMKYLDLINYLSNYKRELEKITIIPKFNSKIKEYLPDSYILEYKLEIFYIILVILWYKFNNKAGIREYYQSLNKYLLDDFKIIIPDNYANTLFTYNDFINPSKDFYSVLAYVYYKTINSIQLLKYESVEYTKNICSSCTRANCYFPDCGETTLRNFLNIIFYDVVNNSFNYRRLCELEANDKLKEFYTKFNSFTLQSSNNKINIFNKELNARDAWSIIVSNLPNVKYIQSCELNENRQRYIFELNTGLSYNQIPNILEVIKQLFKKINKLEDFEEIEINNSLNTTTGLGLITFKKLSTNAQYNINIMDGHYDFNETKEELINFDYSYLKEKKYINLLLNVNIEEILTADINDVYLIKYNNELLIKILNNFGEQIDNKKYEPVIKYIDKNFTNDEKRRIDFLLSKIPNFYEYNLKPYGIEIELTPDNKILTLEINSISDNELQEMIKLKLLEIITHLTFGRFFNQIVNNLPTSIIYLTFGQLFNKAVDNLPKNITHLTFRSNFDQRVDNLPKNITHLTFGVYFDQRVDNLPKNITHLTFGDMFNQPVDNLPDSITHLIFGDMFRQKIDNLPNSITHLTFGSLYNVSIYKFPNSLTCLTFGSDFNQQIDHLSNSITHLNFGNNFNQTVDILPDSVTHLTFGQLFNKAAVNLPKNITHLIFGYNFNYLLYNLPISVTHLTVGNNFNEKLKYLPNKITHLTIGNNFNKRLDKLPDSLTHLTFPKSRAFFGSLNRLPKKLTHLILPRYHNTIDNLPHSLIYLEVGDCYNEPIDNLLPPSLSYLELGTDFNQSIDNLPKKLSQLILGSEFNQNNVNNLPNSITTFAYYFPVNKKIKLPSCLQQLIILNNHDTRPSSTMVEIPHTVKKIYLKDKLSERFLKDVPEDCIISNFQNFSDISLIV